MKRFLLILNLLLLISSEDSDDQLDISNTGLTIQEIDRLLFCGVGESVEIKVTLTAAKDVIGAGASSNRTPGPTATEEFDWSENSASTPQAAAANSLNETEKENIRKMMEALGL